MSAELFADIAEAIREAVDTSKACTVYIAGKLTDFEVASFEDTCRYRIELSGV